MHFFIQWAIKGKLHENTKQSSKKEKLLTFSEKKINELVKLSAEAEKLMAEELAENKRLHKKVRPPGQLDPNDPYYNPHHHMDDGFVVEHSDNESKKESNEIKKNDHTIEGGTSNLRGYPQPK